MLRDILSFGSHWPNSLSAYFLRMGLSWGNALLFLLWTQQIGSVCRVQDINLGSTLLPIPLAAQKAGSCNRDR